MILELFADTVVLQEFFVDSSRVVYLKLSGRAEYWSNGSEWLSKTWQVDGHDDSFPKMLDGTNFS